MLTTVEFADAVRKGMGRAVLAVDGPVSKEFEDIILAACLEDQRHDRQLEGNRTTYNMMLVDRARLADKLQALIVKPIGESLDNWDRLQRIRFIGQYAERGNQKAIELLRQMALVPETDTWDILVEIGDIEWITRNILPTMPLDEKWRIGMWREESPGLSDEAILALSAAEEEYDVVRNRNIAERESRKPPTFDEAIESIQKGARSVSGVVQLARSISDDELLQVAALWLEEKDIVKGRNYSYFFKEREFPLPVSDIVRVVKQGDPPFGYEEILSYCQDPICRELGMFLLNQPEPNYRGFQCMSSSFLDEDLPFMVKCLERFLPMTDHIRHHLGMDLRTLTDDMSSEEKLPFLLWAYEHNPCSTCRGFTASVLVEDGTLPDHYREEMKFDADSFARELAAKAV